MKKTVLPSTNYEKNSQPLASKRKFFFRMLSSIFYSMLVLLFSLFIGTWGYHFFAGVPWVDSFLNASMILTGMGPVDKMDSDAAKIFSSLYAIYSGVAFLSTISLLFAPVLHRLLHWMNIEDGE
ncbi:MAG: hypothetical protein ACOYOA_15015 [Saprospiraceae bacterium]